MRRKNAIMEVEADGKNKKEKYPHRKQYVLGSARVNREFKSSVFAKLFSDRKALLYFSRLYEAYIKMQGLDIYGTKRLTLPTPRTVVFYNGTQEYADEMELKLSDSFQNGDGCIELTVTMLNINYGHNRKLLENCRVLDDYSRFIDKIRENEKCGMVRAEAVDAACQYCIEQDVLRAFLLKHRSEVIEVLLSTFDLDAHVRSENRIVQVDTIKENLLELIRSHLGEVPAKRKEEIEKEESLEVLNRWFKEECAAAENRADAAENRADVAEQKRDAAEAEVARLRAVLAAKENG